MGLAKTNNPIALELTQQLGITEPTQHQLELLGTYVSSIGLTQIKQLFFHERLSQKESLCLFWSALGKTADQTAEILRVKKQTILSHRKEIKRKLNCDSMAHAVFVGLKLTMVSIPSKLKNHGLKNKLKD